MIKLQDINITIIQRYRINSMEKIPLSSSYEGYTLAIIPMGLPGIGKSRVFESLQKSEEANKIFEFDFVSSDEIRKICMDKYKIEHPDVSDDEAFKSTAGPYKTEFSKALNNAGMKKIKGKAHCIIVDKNHPGNGFTARSEERRVGKEWIRLCRSMWSPCD